MNKFLHFLSPLVALIILVSGARAKPSDVDFYPFRDEKLLQNNIKQGSAINKNEKKAQVASWVLHGNVTDENNDPLPGASVVVIGTSRGTVTDADGKFMLEILTENDSLAVSFIGYKPAG